MICTSIATSTAKEALADIKLATDADILEIRLDCIKDINTENLKKLIKTKKIRKIVTMRKKSEGGLSTIDEGKRIQLLKHAIDNRPDFVDIELKSGIQAIMDIKKSIKNTKTKLIISFHNFRKTDASEVASVFNQIRSLKPDIIKIVTFANSLHDNIIIFDIIKKAKQQNLKIIALCMGEKGEISRILSTFLGAELTFGSLAKGKESAPGQLTTHQLKHLFRVNQLKNPKIFGLVGNPVKHSKGIIIHNNLFAKQKLNAVYVNFLAEDINSFIEDFRNMISGVSITVPFKTAVLPNLNILDKTAKNVGAVNTVVKKNGKLVGYNTDMDAAIQSIKEKTAIRDKDILLIGAGGAARAIAFGIVKEKGKLIIVNRTKEKAAELAAELHCRHGGLDAVSKLDSVDIIINTTSLGMFPLIEETPLKKNILQKIIKKNTVVFDTIYNPLETQLLKDARSLGCTIINGIEMLINQAAAQFELWTAKKAPKEFMKKVVLNGLQ